LIGKKSPVTYALRATSARTGFLLTAASLPPAKGATFAGYLADPVQQPPARGIIAP
jgi:hypothetical protein